MDETHHVAPGYGADVLISWVTGCWLTPGFDPNAQTAAAQAKQFGYNNDFVGYVPLDGRSEHGLLVVNHEYTNGEIMFPGLSGRRTARRPASGDDEGHRRRRDGRARRLRDRDPQGRRPVGDGAELQVRPTHHRPDTEMELTGPVAGHGLMMTKADPTGKEVVGMINNCAGGVTPWGTWLSAEENTNGYF